MIGGVRHVDDAGAGLDLRKLGAAEQVARAGPGRQLRDDPVAFGEQRRQRHVAGLAVRAPRRPARACADGRAHACRRPGARMAISRPISPRPMMPMVAPLSARVPPSADVVAAGRVAAGRTAGMRRRRPRCVRRSPGRRVRRACAPASASAPKACSAQEMLARRRSVSTLMPFSAQAAVSMLRKPRAEFLHDLELRLAAARSSRPTRNDSTTSATQSLQVRAHLGFGRHHPHLGGIEPRRALPHALAPAGEIGLVGRHEIGEGRAALLARLRIEHERNEPRERIVLDHDDGKARHAGGLQFFFGSRSTRSAVNTRLCMR